MERRVSAVRTLRTWARMVKFSHSVFALPFAFSGAALAAAETGITVEQVLWIALAMIGARNAAMGFNRLVDERYDAHNPRTRNRELPTGELSRAAVWAFTGGLAALFVFASFRLNPLCGWLSPVALVVILGYSLTKRFTWLSHAVLGVALAMAPVGGWIAVSGRADPPAWMLGAAVVFWVAGFDVVYACQDLDFDRRTGLHSVPARFGMRGALWLARGLHVAALLALGGVGWLTEMHPIYWAGWAAIGALMLWEHRLVRADDLSRVGLAFFDLNGVISVVYFATTLAALLLPRVLG